MLNVKTLSVLAFAGSAIAAPQWPGSWAGKYFGGDRGDGHDAVATALEIVTAYTTVFYDGGSDGDFGDPQPSVTDTPITAAATPTPVAPAPVAASSSSSDSPAPAAFTPVFSYAPVASSSAPAAYSPAPVIETPTAAPTPVASSSAPAAASSTAVASSGSSDGSYMSIVNKWRVKIGMSQLTESDTLQANALKTVTDSNGQMVHELNPGSFAQVLAPGNAGNFENVFVGGWLCERPDIQGLDGICTTMSQGWAYDGQTGHADILTSKAYSKIGCALYAGIWGCDLA